MAIFHFIGGESRWFGLVMTSKEEKLEFLKFDWLVTASILSDDCPYSGVSPLNHV